MEELKKFVLNAIIFDNWQDPKGTFFERALSEAIDSELIYYSDCKKFFEINPIMVINLSRQNGYEVDPSEDTIDQITDYAREAFSVLCYNYLYGELEKRYLKAQKKAR